MRNNKNTPQTKSESRISAALRQYARTQMEERANNIYQVPKSQLDNKNQIVSKNNYVRQNNPTMSNDQSKRNEYKEYKRDIERRSEPNIPYRTINQNRNYLISKNEKNDDKKYSQRSTFTYKQPEPKNLNENYRDRKVISNNMNNNVKRKYETTSYEHPGRRKRQYENKDNQEEKFAPKYYRNNPHKYNDNFGSNNNGSFVAQKICNIVIKGDSSNIEKESINISNNKRRNRNRMIEYEVEEPDINYNNNEEEIDEDLMKKEKNKKNKRRNKMKKQNQIIEMQKAQSFQQPRDYNFMPKQKNSKPKLIIGIENKNDNKNNYIKEKDKNIPFKNR